jgi:hypothetical protein
MKETPMKRLASAVAVSAVLVLTPVGLAGTASAQVYYPSCSAAAAVGVYNIQRGEAGYSAELDSDGDGVACEKDGAGSGSGSNGSTGSTSQDESVSSSGSSRPDQVTVVPEGGAETGDGSTETGSGWWVGGGLLAAVAGLVGARRVRARV